MELGIGVNVGGSSPLPDIDFVASFWLDTAHDVWAHRGLTHSFLFIVVMNYIPGLTNADGQLLGLFRIDPIDNIVHMISCIWAAVAAYRSTRASVLYFRIFEWKWTCF